MPASISLHRKAHLVARTNQIFLLCSEQDVMLSGIHEAMTAWYQASKFLAKVCRLF